jgi:hypothetical protein
MAFALIGIFLLLILMLVAIKFGLNRDRITNEQDEKPVLHASGIYSIVKKSPRENALSSKPPKEDILKYLGELNEDIDGQPLSAQDKETLITLWEEAIEESISTIEKGDIEGIEFYYFDFIPEDCPVCLRHFTRGKFVTREEIFRCPVIIPPFHLGCTCKLLPHHGSENLRETTELGMLPFFKKQEPPPLPEWQSTKKINVA